MSHLIYSEKYLIYIIYIEKFHHLQALSSLTNYKYCFILHYEKLIQIFENGKDFKLPGKKHTHLLAQKLRYYTI